ncbi:MAG: VWA domain-containing protein [Thiotrichaceae bacterium]|nr:VWA domain-containing protein [Thiotrichaceae bacterium]
MRRLPIYFLIDVSESMIGEPIEQVEEGISTIIQTLKSDPNAMETVWVSIIVFAGKTQTLLEYQELISFYPPKFFVGSGTSLSSGLEHLMKAMDKDVRKTTAEQKGDWKPIVFLFTDGTPTDDTAHAIGKWKKTWSNSANMVAVSIGEESNLSLLGEMTDNVLNFKNTDKEAYSEFFKWVTNSIKISSIAIDKNNSDFDLAPTTNDALSKIDLSKLTADINTNSDENHVVLVAKCQKTKQTYLIKYKRAFGMIINKQNDCQYHLVGAYKVNDSYFELSDMSYIGAQVNTSRLMGAPTCPCCGNQHSFAVCSCSKLHCIGVEGLNTCPWCGVEGQYGSSAGGMNIEKAQG